MRIQILEEALNDLHQGFRFYEGQEAGLGAYFLEPDIDSPFTTLESTRRDSRTTVRLPSASRLQFTIGWIRISFAYMRCWTAEGTRLGSVNGCTRVPDELWVRSSRHLENERRHNFSQES